MILQSALFQSNLRSAKLTCCLNAKPINPRKSLHTIGFKPAEKAGKENAEEIKNTNRIFLKLFIIYLLNLVNVYELRQQCKRSYLNCQLNKSYMIIFENSSRAYSHFAVFP